MLIISIGVIFFCYVGIDSCKDRHRYVNEYFCSFKIITILPTADCMLSMLYYMENFHWSQTDADQLSFILVTMRAAVEFLRGPDVQQWLPQPEPTNNKLARVRVLSSFSFPFPFLLMEFQCVPIMLLWVGRDGLLVGFNKAIVF